MTAWPGAVLFDFDGVIVDSEELHMRAYLATAQRLGIPLTREQYFAELIGFDDRGAWGYLFEKNKRPISAAELQSTIAQKLDVMRGIMQRREYQALPGVERFVSLLRERRIGTGICTGALREEVETMLAGIGMRELFDAVISAQDVTIGKPDPLGYALTMQRVSEKIGGALEPSDCIVVEDAPSVIRSVKQVGFKTIGVTTTYPAARLVDADWIVATLEPETVRTTIPQLGFL